MDGRNGRRRRGRVREGRRYEGFGQWRELRHDVRHQRGNEHPSLTPVLVPCFEDGLQKIRSSTKLCAVIIKQVPVHSSGKLNVYQILRRCTHALASRTPRDPPVGRHKDKCLLLVLREHAKGHPSASASIFAEAGSLADSVHWHSKG